MPVTHCAIWFSEKPYKLEPYGTEKVDFGNVRIPKKMKVIDLINKETEIMEFSKNR